MNDKQHEAESGQGAGQDGTTGITRRNMLRGLGVMAAVAPAVAAVAVAAEDSPVAAKALPAVDLLDEQFTSVSGRRFGSQVIHCGEQNGDQVTPISQDKCAPGYQRPGNLNNPTVAALLRCETNSDSVQPSRCNSSATIRSARASAFSRRKSPAWCSPSWPSMRSNIWRLNSSLPKHQPRRTDANASSSSSVDQELLLLNVHAGCPETDQRRRYHSGL